MRDGRDYIQPPPTFCLCRGQRVGRGEELPSGQDTERKNWECCNCLPVLVTFGSLFGLGTVCLLPNVDYSMEQSLGYLNYFPDRLWAKLSPPKDVSSCFSFLKYLLTGRNLVETSRKPEGKILRNSGSGAQKVLGNSGFFFREMGNPIIMWELKCFTVFKLS